MVVHNPNNWHWVDKNCLPWATSYFSEKLPLLELHDSSISSVSTSGDCDVSNRKGKVICIYDMTLDLSIDGKNGGESFSGTLTVRDFMHDEKDYEYDFKGFGSHKTFVQKTLLPIIQKQLWKFQEELLAAQEEDLQKNNVAHA